MNAQVQVNAQWAARLAEFNLHVARTAHCTWFTERIRRSAFDAQGVLHSRAERPLSEWLLATHDLKRHMDWRMEEPCKRIWLLDSPSLARLARELSVLMHREWLVRVIDGAALRDIRERIDPVLWRLMVEEMPVGAAHHEQPRVSFLKRECRELHRDLLKDGASTMLALLDPECKAVRGRARLRFDSELQFEQSECAQPNRVVSLICGWLVPRRLPQWAWLF